MPYPNRHTLQAQFWTPEEDGFWRVRTSVTHILEMAHTLGNLSAAVPEQYTLEREIGAGGMATVYLAKDHKHGRDVAIKIIRPELAATLGADRFVREIEIAARLTHPHILSLFDSGEADGLLYYVMPFVDGESLRDRLDREGTIPVPAAIRITEQVASALSYAHARGVVHRDVKPGNILLADDQAIVADFGIARAVEAAGGERLTGTGLVMGTPTYMSPEQGLGEANIDGRSDTYALGCVFYEMLVGDPPFRGGSLQIVIARHVSAPVPSLRDKDPEIPLFVERAVERALAKKPVDRFASPAAFAETLTSERVAPPVGRRRLAVLPPVNLARDADQAHLIMGLHESLISQLGQGDVAVLARTSVLQYQETEKPVREIARELGVEAVIESSLFCSNDPIGVEVRLVDGTTEESVWSGSYDGDVGNVFGLYRDVARSIAHEIHGALAPPTSTTQTDRRTVDPVAYENYMRGRVYQERFTPPDFETALQYYKAALDANPDYAPAYAGTALIWGSKIVLGVVPPIDAAPFWKDAAERAVSLDPQLPEAHLAMAMGVAWQEWDWEAAEAAFKRSIELDPNDPQARSFYSHFLACMQRPVEATRQAKRAMEIDPFNPFHRTLHGIQLNMAGQYPEAVEQLDQAVEAAPDNVLARVGLAQAHHMLGDLERGLAYQAEYFEMLGDTEVVEAFSNGDDIEVRYMRAAEVLAQRAEQVFVKPFNILVLFDRAGDLDRAAYWMEKSYEGRDSDMSYLSAAPLTSAFRADPRFHEMLRRMKLPTAPAEVAG